MNCVECWWWEYAIHCIVKKVYSVHCTVQVLQYALYIVKSVKCSECTLYSVHCIVYKVYSVQSMYCSLPALSVSKGWPTATPALPAIQPATKSQDVIS